MRRILSITRQGIEAVRIAFGRPPTERLPPLRMITHPPEPASESRSVTEPPPVPAPIPDKANDDDLELQRICEAIGLDVREVTREVTGEAPPRRAMHVESNDLSNDVSDDVLKLIQHVEATNAHRPGFRPGTGMSPEVARAAVTRTHAKSPRAANRESAQPPSRESDLVDVLASLKLRLLKIRLPADDMAEAQAEITTVIAQLLSPRGKPQIIALSLETLIAILEKAGPAALTRDVETSLTRIRAFLLQLDV